MTTDADLTPRIMTVAERLTADVERLFRELPDARWVSTVSLGLVCLMFGVLAGMAWTYADRIDALQARVLLLEVAVIQIKHDMIGVGCRGALESDRP